MPSRRPERSKTRVFYKTDRSEHRKTRVFYKTDRPEHGKTRVFYKTDRPERRKTRVFYKTDRPERVFYGTLRLREGAAGWGGRVQSTPPGENAEMSQSAN